MDRHTNWLSFLLTIVLMTGTSVIAGCGSDDSGGSGNGNGNGTSDTSAQDVSDAGTDTSADDTSDDTAGEDDSGEDDTSNGDDATSDTSPGDGSDQDASDTNVSDTGQDTADTRGDCGAGSNQPCAYPASAGSCPQGDWGAGSFIHTFEIPDEDACCFDIDGDGTIDNSFGGLKPTIEALTGGIGINTIIQARIENGVLNYLLTYANWRNPVNDASADVDIVFGESSSTYSDKSNGNGVFQVATESIDANGDPLSALDPADICNSSMTVAGGSTPIKVPVGAETLDMTLNDVHLTADVVAPTDLSADGRVGLTNGQLGGYMTLDEIYSGLNSLSNACDCLQKDVFESSSGTYECTATESDASTCENDGVDDAFCDEFLSNSTNCNVAADLINAQADIDSTPGNSDSSFDAISLGATFEASGADITDTASQ